SLLAGSTMRENSSNESVQFVPSAHQTWAKFTKRQPTRNTETRRRPMIFDLFSPCAVPSKSVTPRPPNGRLPHGGSAPQQPTSTQGRRREADARGRDIERCSS